MGSPLFPNFNSRRQAQRIAADIAKRAGSAARSAGALTQWIANQISGKVDQNLGVTGMAIEALMRPFGRGLERSHEDELRAAHELIEAIGQPELVDPRGGDNIPTARPSYRVGSNFPPEDDDWRRFTDDTPVLEGMIEVESSNVHSIGFEHIGEHGVGNLLVRFLGSEGKHRCGPGAMYRYSNVPLSVWHSFRQAASYGKAVWDDLRVRGTVSGHQYSYDLIDASTIENIPRQAAFKRGRAGEYFIPRNFEGRRSTLPEQQVRGPRGQLPGWDRRGTLRLRETGRRDG